MISGQIEIDTKSDIHEIDRQNLEEETTNYDHVGSKVSASASNQAE